MQLPLEDHYEDVLGKAARGHSLTTSDLAEKSGLGVDLLESLLDGNFDEGATRKVAPLLGLGADRVVALGKGTYQPAAPAAIDGLAGFNTPFEDMTVNAYLVWDPASREAAVFDTGSDVSAILERITSEGLTVKQVFVTHSHGDHIYDLDRLLEKTGAEAWGPEGEPVEGVQPFSAGKAFRIGSLEVETRLTWGHCPGGITYVIRGLAVPVAIVGDAVFAGSMGGGGVSYEAALRTNRDEIFSLADETILCPGHGPMTTVGEEKANNPFYPDLG